MLPPRASLIGIVPVVALLLAGCDTLGLGGTPPAPPAARAIDYRADDLASLIVVLDLPATLQPVARGSVASFDVTTEAKGSRHVRAVLALADGDAVAPALPAPAAGHTYYLLGFSERDGASLAAAQKWLAGLPPGAPPAIAFTVAPRLCETEPLDPSRAFFSVIPALPGAGPLLPLIASAPLTSLLQGGQLPPCGSV